MRYVRGFARFWWDFVVGDDWRLAAAVAAVLAVGGALVALDAAPDGVLAAVTGAALGAATFAVIVLPRR